MIWAELRGRWCCGTPGHEKAFGIRGAGG